MQSGAKYLALLSVVLFAAVAAPTAAAEDELFPFVVSYDAPENVTNVASWLDAPAGRQGFVRAEDGRLATDAGPIRLWATNLCFEACFPSHEQAERLAARLARLGINCVRMHHMDSYSIWGDSPNKLTIDPKKLERLDYLIDQLKRQGIYTNINLHVSRTLGRAEGFATGEGKPNYDKGLDNFEPRMIEMQKKYARDLLTHVNPYTKTAYVDEPAVAMVEISNEDALFAVWGWGQLDDLPEPYATTFRKLWNVWLRKKYGDTTALRKAWNAGSKPLGRQMLRNGNFTGPLDGTWSLERDAETEVSWSVVPVESAPDNSPIRSGRCLRVVVTRQGTVSWHPQIHQSGLVLKKGEPYTLSCWVRSDKSRQIDVNCMMAHEPWQRLGLSGNVKVSPEWQPARFTFVAEQDDENARITFSSLVPGTYELADISFQPGGIFGLGPDQQLEDDSVPVLKYGEMNLTRAARADFIDFLWDTEADYWWGMHKFLKEDLGCRPLLTGTQLSYSPVHVQAALDYIDAHAYWKHPRFPRRPWDSRDWEVHNVALVNDPPGTLGSLAARRVDGMAYTVSEYNHPAPNVYAAEGFPMIAAFGAFQRWDGVFNFTYSHNTDFEPRRITGFFDIKGDTSRLVHMPACAAMFLRGDVSPAKETVLAAVSRQLERQQLHETLSAWRLTAAEFGVDPRLSLRHAIALKLDGSAPGKPPEIPGETKQFVSDTGQIRWDVAQSDAGYFVVDTPRAKLFTGFVAGRTFELGDVKLKIGPTRLDWATVSMLAVDGQGFDQPGRILVAATGWVQNTAAKLEDLGGDRVTLRNQWGDEPLLCEGVPAQVALPVAADRVTLYPLDESGDRRQPVAVGNSAGYTVLPLGPKCKTVWYEVVVR